MTGLLRAGVWLLAILVVWQAAVFLFEPPHYILPGPGRVAHRLIADYPLLLRHGRITLTEICLGLLLGTALGMSTALVMRLFPAAQQLIQPVLIVSQALPVFAIAPLLVLWFGYGLGSKVAMTTLIIYFPVASSLHDGLGRTEPGLIDLARLWHADRFQQIALFRLPSAVPALISGMRVAVTVAPIGAVVGEWVGASSGLGFLMLRASSRFQTDQVFASLFVLAVIGLVLRSGFDLAVSRYAAWVVETP